MTYIGQLVHFTGQNSPREGCLRNPSPFSPVSPVPSVKPTTSRECFGVTGSKSSQMLFFTLGLEGGVDETQSHAKVTILYLFCTLYSNGRRSVSHDTQGNGGMEKVGKRRRETETGWSGEQWRLPSLYRSSSEEGERSGGGASRNIYTAFLVLLQNHELFLPKIRGRDDGKYRETNPCIQATPWCQYLLEKITRLQRKEVKKLEGNCGVGSKGIKPESEQLKSCSPSLMGFLLWEGMVQTVGKRWKETWGLVWKMVTFSKVKGLEDSGKTRGKRKKKRGKRDKNAEWREKGLSRLPGRGNRGPGAVRNKKEAPGPPYILSPVLSRSEH